MTGRFNIATIMVPLGLMLIGAIFLAVGIQGSRIVALIFGGVCVAGGLAAVVALIVSQFRSRKKG